MTEPPQEQREQSENVLWDIHDHDPPPPYPSPHPRTRTQRTRLRTIRTLHRGLPTADQNAVPHRELDEPLETTPLLPSARRHRSGSHSSTVRSSSSCTPSLAHTIFSLFYDPEGESEDDGHRQQSRHDAQLSSHDALGHPTRWPLFSKRAWARYFRPLGRRAYHAAVFHLLVLNFPYALMAWIYLFVFTLVSPPSAQGDCTDFLFKTGTTLIITLPIGAVLCFLDLLGARAFASGEVTKIASLSYAALNWSCSSLCRPSFMGRSHTRLRIRLIRSFSARDLHYRPNSRME